MGQEKPKVIVLLSAGLDSTVNLYKALQVCEVVGAITFDYGQKAAPREIECSARLCNNLKVPHHVIEMDWFGKMVGSSALVSNDHVLPMAKSVDISDSLTSRETAKAVWVPNRNGVLLNIAAAYAEAKGAKYIVPGFNREEAETFPDNSVNFTEALSESLFFSTSNHVEVKCFTATMNKAQIVELGRELSVPFDLIWPCYQAQPTLCGECESCQRFQQAMEKNQ